MIAWLAVRIYATLLPLWASLMAADWLYHTWPPAFTGNACPGTAVVNGQEILTACGVFPVGLVLPIAGMAISAGVGLKSYRDYKSFYGGQSNA